jgi:hypothetical protein
MFQAVSVKHKSIDMTYISWSHFLRFLTEGWKSSPSYVKFAHDDFDADLAIVPPVEHLFW